MNSHVITSWQRHCRIGITHYTKRYIYNLYQAGHNGKTAQYIFNINGSVVGIAAYENITADTDPSRYDEDGVLFGSPEDEET